MGHSRPGEVRWPKGRLLHPGAVCHNYVRRDVTCYVQERSELAQGSGEGVRKHPHRVVRQQGRHQRQKGEGQEHRVPQEEKFAGEIIMFNHLGS